MNSTERTINDEGADIITILLTALLLTVSYSSYADEQITLSWTETTEYTDETPIEEGDLIKYLAYCGDAPAIEILAPNLTHVITLPSGEHGCYVTSVAMINGVEVESVPSNVVGIRVKRSRPKPPVLSTNQ